jgi:hypothetical protein
MVALLFLSCGQASVARPGRIWEYSSRFIRFERPEWSAPHLVLRHDRGVADVGRNVLFITVDQQRHDELAVVAAHLSVPAMEDP